MDSLNDAEANLRTIRQLMERATTYRAISGPVALVAGFLACLNCFYFAYIPRDVPYEELVMFWRYSWYGILGIVIVTNAVLLYRASRKVGESLLNSRAKMALLSAFPALFAGFAIGLHVTTNDGSPEYLWLLCYGLAICSTSTFSPRSLVILGYSIVAIALIFSLFETQLLQFLGHLPPLRILPYQGDVPPIVAQILAMFIGFGLTHIFYAACVPWKIAPDD